MRAGSRPQPPSAAFCPLHRSGSCRSCPHQDLPLADQLARKHARVASVLARARVPDGVWLDPVASAPSRFRNKAKMVVCGTASAPVLGILGPDGRGVDLRRCPLHLREIERALPVLARAVARLRIRPYDVAARRGELKHVLVTASPDGDLMVRWVLRSDRHEAALRAELPRLREELGTLAVMSVNLQPVHQAIIEGEEERLLTDDSPDGDRLLMRLRLGDDGMRRADAGRAGRPGHTGRPGRGGPGATGAGRPGPNGRSRELPLLLPTRSFFQTNTAVAEALYTTAAAWAADLDEGAEVWDLFCGVGGFALALAGADEGADGGRRVLGVEVSAPAIAGARRAAALMGLSAGRVRFEAGDARVLDPGRGAAPDLLVVNPPRRGIGAGLAGRIEASGVRRVLYSSCNPQSLARDLGAMPSLSVRRARLFDMFPHTDHAEVLVELVRRPSRPSAPPRGSARSGRRGQP
ncbi:23S rRNA methyltransferase [Actinomyces sp. oral taxon 414]|uniref:methyltransferase domain-containing protein n=1 Tax=Actinomyces sp. oral taxon 414 TaxID=712122 RepID=UPI0006AE3509|nr:methyltransferase domain-containing protein [Actinomyces sp. oral taxon 414]ALD00032.1 23S rRNA methyltransferase [Actinomyces sp. oral taxon 414]